MKIVLRNVDVIHPEEKLSLENVSVFLTDGLIAKIGDVTSDETKDAKEFDL